MEQAHKTSAKRVRWIIWGLVVSFLTILWSSSLHWAQWLRKGQQNVFWESEGKNPPPTLLPDWLQLTIPAMLLFQLVATSVVVWRTKDNRLVLSIILFVLWMVSAIFSMAYYSGF
jgi:hypothetical protein